MLVSIYSRITYKCFGVLPFSNMGISDVGDDDFPVDRSLTVEEVIDRYGKEAVRRGMEYMLSLQDADANYRQSARDTDGYSEEVTEAYTGERTEMEELDERWSESMEERGLGIDEE